MMDHLPSAVGARGPDLLVPCVCDPPYYDGSDWESFPAQRGFRLLTHGLWPSGIINQDKTSIESGQMAKICQAWLFFGQLIEVFKAANVFVNPDDFVKSDGPNKYITMRSFAQYVAQWKNQAVALSGADRRKIFERQSYIVRKVDQVQEFQLAGHWPFEEGTGLKKETIPFLIEISIVILNETLDRITSQVCGLEHFGSGYKSNDALTENLMKTGWCPSESSLVHSSLDVTTTYLASQLHRKRATGDHSHCSATKCTAFNIRVESYETQHLVCCSGCKSISVDANKLASILREGQTPRACITLTGTETDLQVEVAIETSGPYIAISHVWSDGLGNAEANSLPSCQLRRLYKLALALNLDPNKPPPGIWIDSLLVPVRNGPEKRLALAQLYHYYQQADKVLVLDSDLLQSSRCCSREEQFLRVLFSTWMRRLWTLEEGLLSRSKLMFQFRDGMVSIDDIRDDGYASSSTTCIYRNLQDIFAKFLPNVANTFVRQESQSVQLSHELVTQLLPALQYRSTTKAIDEPVCIAHILGLNVSRLLYIGDVPSRMKELILMMADQGTLFPRHFFFTQEPKIELNGFRWAPKSFMSLSTDDTDYLRSVGASTPARGRYTTCNSNGLYIRGMQCFKINLSGQTLKKVTFVKFHSKPTIIFVVIPVPVGESTNNERFWSTRASEKAFNINPDQHWNTEWQSMLGTSPTHIFILYDSLERGIAVITYNSQGDPSDPDESLFFGHLIGRVNMYDLVCDTGRSIVETDKQVQAALDSAFNPEHSIFAQVTHLEDTQRWYIG